MVHFRRLLKYVLAQKGPVVSAMLCALLVAVLTSVNFTAMIPVIKMMLDDRGIHSWAESKLVFQRTGVEFKVSEAKQDKDGKVIEPGPMLVTTVDPVAVSKNALGEGDSIIYYWKERPGEAEAVKTELGDKYMYPVEIIAAMAESEKPLWLLVQHKGDKYEILNFNTGDKPVWCSWSLDLLNKIPRGYGNEYKYRCIKVVLWAIMILSLARCFSRYMFEYSVRKISFTSIKNLRNDTFSRTIRLPLTVYTQEGVSDTISRFIQDTNMVSKGISVLFGKAMVEPLKIICAFGAAYVIEPKITKVIILCSPLILILVLKLGRKNKKATSRTLQRWSVLLGKLQESFLGIKVIKGYHQENWETQRFQQANQELYSKQLRKARVEAASSPSLEAIAFTVGCVGMMFALPMLQDSKMDPGNFLVLLVLLATSVDSARKLGDVLPSVQEANASAQRVFELHDRPMETDAPNAVVLPPLHESMEFNDVWFKYPGSVDYNLKGVSLKVKAGETIAVVGPNGSGKTTLLSMIPRFFDLEKGQVIIDGIDTANATLESLRGQLGIVTQNTIVFNDTIANNIAYGRPGADIETIKQAARHAYAEEFILEKAKGYDEIIGQQGSTLSGGQLQRLAIARAILRNPSILIFDEATSQIDSDSEAKIQKALKEFCVGRTAFIIAHRLSTIVDADKIVVMDRGEVLACGSHDELLESCQLYRTLYETQFGSNRNEQEK